jgi:hypothetical protein
MFSFFLSRARLSNWGAGALQATIEHGEVTPNTNRVDHP